MLVLGENRPLDLLLNVLDGENVPSAKDMRAEHAEPDVNGVEPRAVLGRRDEADAMCRITERGLSRLHVLEDAPRAFFPEDLIVLKKACNEANQRRTCLGSESHVIRNE